MGTWALPFEDRRKAREFCRMMARPWVASVEKDEEGSYLWRAKGLSSGNQTCLYGDDGLWDYLGEIADKKRKAFDIRPFVKECLAYHLWHVLHQLESRYDTDVLLMIAKVLKFEKSARAATAFQDALSEQLKSSRFDKRGVISVSAQDPKLKWTFETMPTGLPQKLRRSRVFAAKVSGKSADGLKAALHGAFEVVKVVKGTGLAAQMSTIFFVERRRDEVLPADLERTSIALTYTDRHSNKFWNCDRKGSEVIIRFGAAKTRGRLVRKRFSSQAGASKYFALKVREKLGKGYREGK